MIKRLFVLPIALVLVGAMSGPIPGQSLPTGPITGETRLAISALDPGEMLSVSVVLHARADLSFARGLERKQRPAAVVTALQATAEASQQPLRTLLGRLEDHGEVDEFETFWVVNGATVTASADAIAAIAQLPSVESIDLQPELAALGSYSPSSTEPNLEVVGAPDLWAQGITGEGVVVATLDSGVFLHTDVAESYRGGANSWFDPYGEHEAPFDSDGHGTATMSVIVGRDGGGSAIGMAPDAQWITAKIFDDSGNATSSAIHEAFQWLLDPDGDPATPDTPDVVSNSWAVGSAGCDTTFQQDLAALRAAGILPVFAAGNAGPNSSSSRSPGNLPEAFSVGAVNNNDTIYSSSSRGPSSCSGDTLFPDMVAPGVSIKVADYVDGFYWYATGTSIAAPHVAGALALLLEQRPNLTAGQQETLLIAGAVDLGTPGPDTTFGSGRLDVKASSDAETPNLPPVASFSVSKGKKGMFDFDATASFDPDGSIVSYTWDFGDGAFDSGVNVSHKYESSGTYTVTLTVVDDGGAESAITSDVTNGGGGGGKGGGGSGGGGGGGHGGGGPPKKP